jgi:hypothetical protein
LNKIFSKICGNIQSVLAEGHIAATTPRFRQPARQQARQPVDEEQMDESELDASNNQEDHEINPTHNRHETLTA